MPSTLWECLKPFRRKKEIVFFGKMPQFKEVQTPATIITKLMVGVVVEPPILCFI